MSEEGYYNSPAQLAEWLRIHYRYMWDDKVWDIPEVRKIHDYLLKYQLSLTDESQKPPES